MSKLLITVVFLCGVLFLLWLFPWSWKEAFVAWGHSISRGTVIFCVAAIFMLRAKVD